MFASRNKIFLACLTVVFCLTPCLGQVGSVVGRPQPGDSLPGENPSGRFSGNGVIQGSVRTLSNNPVANARVEILSPAQGPLAGSQFTGNDGSFSISNLPPGTYELRAESGVHEASERVQVTDGETWVTLRLPVAGQAEGGNANAPSVSVGQLRVPSKAVSLLRKARGAISKNRLERAAEFVARALAVYPEYAEALALRGVLEIQHHQFQQAASDAHHAIQADPNYGVGYLVMGAALNCEKKYQEALPPLQRAEALAPGAWQGYFESSKALLQLGKYQEALQQASRGVAVGKGSPHPEFHLMKGYAYAGLRTYGAALNELKEYLSQDPNGAYAANARATVAQLQPLAMAASH